MSKTDEAAMIDLQFAKLYDVLQFRLLYHAHPIADRSNLCATWLLVIWSRDLLGAHYRTDCRSTQRKAGIYSTSLPRTMREQRLARNDDAPDALVYPDRACQANGYLPPLSGHWQHDVRSTLGRYYQRTRRRKWS